jgi:hypothetical protein
MLLDVSYQYFNEAHSAYVLRLGLSYTLNDVKLHLKSLMKD